MRYDFSAEFLRILPPDTSFGEAWESLCEILLRTELDSTKLVRLRPPDLGIDMLYRLENKAFQCKSSERGIYGRIDAEESAKSLETAIKHKLTLGWCQYSFATNAEYTGAGFEKILLRARDKGLGAEHLEFLGPAYWDQMCVEHSKLIENRFDYRVSLGERDLFEALQRIVLQPRPDVSVSAQGSEKRIVITNNLTQLEIEHDLLSELSVETYLKVVMELLGISEFLRGSTAHIETFRPLFSLRAGGKELNLFLRLRDLNVQSGDKLEFYTRLDEEALAVFEQVISQSPENVVAQRARAGLLRSMGRLDEALAGFQAIIIGHPEDTIAKIEYAETLMCCGQLDDALRAYESVLASYPEDVVAQSGRAEVLKLKGLLSEALSAYDSTMDVSSDHEDLKEDGGENFEEAETKGLKEWHEKTWDTERLLQNLIWQTAKKRRLTKDHSDSRVPKSQKLAA